MIKYTSKKIVVLLVILGIIVAVSVSILFNLPKDEDSLITIPVTKGSEVYTVDLSPNGSLSKSPIGEGNIIIGSINGKILVLKGDYILLLGMEQLVFPRGRTLHFIDPENQTEEELIKEPIVIKAFPSHNGKYIAILTKDLHLGILDLETKNFEVVFSDLPLVPSTDYTSKVALAWSLDDSQIFFAVHPKGWGTIFLNNDADLYAYDLASKKVSLVRGNYLVDKYDKFTDENGQEYLMTGATYIVLGVIDTGEAIVDYSQSGKVFEDGSTRDEEGKVIAVSTDGKERILWKLYEKNTPVSEGEFAGLYPLALTNNKLLAVKVKMETVNGVEKDLMDLYLVEFQSGNPISKRLLASNINSGIVAKFISNGLVAYFNQTDPEVSFKGYWTIVDQSGMKIRDLPEGVLP